jgi:hypothetical protein
MTKKRRSPPKYSKAEIALKKEYDQKLAVLHVKQKRDDEIKELQKTKKKTEKVLAKINKRLIEIAEPHFTQTPNGIPQLPNQLAKPSYVGRKSDKVRQERSLVDYIKNDTGIDILNDAELFSVRNAEAFDGASGLPPFKKKAKDCVTEEELEELGHAIHKCKVCHKSTCIWISKLRKKPKVQATSKILPENKDLEGRGLSDSEITRCKEHSKDLALGHAGKKKSAKGKIINKLSLKGQTRHDEGMSPYGSFEMPCVHCTHLRLKAMELGKYGRIREFDELMKDIRSTNADTLEQRILNYANNFREGLPYITFEKYPMYSRATFSTFKNQRQRDNYERNTVKDSKANCRLFGEKTMFDVALSIMDSDTLVRDKDGQIIKIPSSKKPAPLVHDNIPKKVIDPVTGEKITTSDYLVREKERGKFVVGYDNMTDAEKKQFWKDWK